jgi:hypothetical protein
MTARVKAKSNGAVVLNVKATIPAYTRYIRAVASLSDAGEDISAQASAAELIVNWLLTDGGMAEDVLEEVPLGQLGELLAQAGQAFTLPKQTSAP